MKKNRASKNSNLILSQQNLQLQAKFQKLLNNLGYHDIERISREIIEYIKEENKSPQTIEKRLKNNEPWEYIREWCEFKGLRFQVNNNVLIPRIETEQLVNIVHKQVKDFYQVDNDQNKKVTILDIGTGSGCIIISLENLINKNSWSLSKKISKNNTARTTISDTTPNKSRKINFLGTDISKKALKTANQNKNNLNSNVKFLKSDLLKSIPPTLLKDSELFIIANLPYIPSSIYKSLDSSVKDWEPKLALHGGKTGVKILKNLKQQINNLNLNPKKIFLEIDPSIKSEIKNLFPNGKFVKDYRKLDRFYIITSE